MEQRKFPASRNQENRSAAHAYVLFSPNRDNVRNMCARSIIAIGRKRTSPRRRALSYCLFGAYIHDCSTTIRVCNRRVSCIIISNHPHDYLPPNDNDRSGARTINYSFGFPILSVPDDTTGRIWTRTLIRSDFPPLTRSTTLSYPRKRNLITVTNGAYGIFNSK